MEQLVINIEGKANANFVMRLLGKFDFVKSVSCEKQAASSPVSPVVANEPAEEYNWTNPSRPATDEEFEQLAIEMEQDLGEYTTEEVRNFVLKEIKAWRKTRT